MKDSGDEERNDTLFGRDGTILLFQVWLRGNERYLSMFRQQ